MLCVTPGPKNSAFLTTLTLSISVHANLLFENVYSSSKSTVSSSPCPREHGSNVKALVLKSPGNVFVESIPDPERNDEEILLKVRMVGFCGSDLNSFRGLNPLVSYPRILGHEVCATVLESHSNALPAGTDVALNPYTSCGKCASCRRGRPNSCQFNQTLGVQRDGALKEFIAMPRNKLYSGETHVERTVPCRAADGWVSRGCARTGDCK